MIDPTDKNWSALWYWSVLGDSWYSPPEFWLESTAITHKSITYYRAHIAAGMSVLANPDWSTARTILNVSDQRRTAKEVYNDLLIAGKGIDRAIFEATNGEVFLPGYQSSFRSVL